MAVDAATPVRDALAAAADAFAAAGVETPRLDAELLLAEAAGTGRAELVASPEADLAPDAARRFAAMVRRRLRREPVAYILGRKGFRDIELRVDPRALIPRPETEHLVEVAVELEPATVLDVGTGCGAVALAATAELPGAHVVATDTSAGALELAGENARLLGLADRVSVEPGTIPAGRSFDLVLANLPYVREEEWDGLQPEIRNFEPREALVGGPDGLDAIRAMTAQMQASIARGAPPCGAVALEVGVGQAREVTRLLETAGFGGIERRRDLAGHERVVLGRL